MSAPLLRTAALGVVAALLLAACGAIPAAPVVDGRTFLSTGVTAGGVDRPLVPGTQIRLTFSDATNLGVSAGCNSIGGTYRIDGGVLRFTGGAMTEMGCDPERHAQDDWLADLLASGPAISLTGNELTLTAGATTIRLLDREIAEPDLPLVGPTWTVVAVFEGDTVASVPANVVATLQFTPDGRVSISTGCNQGGGQVSATGETLRFTDIVTTKRACQPPAGLIEGKVLGVLRADGVTFSINAGSLVLQGGDVGLQLQAG